ncbi:hypothetical protein [Paraburkholderia bannensis]|uniref:hypothetical protein n=1 Tax=Paraburkholderia bannensis TaxID=765414 RepID=UPI002ABE3BF6|nr:hypothetical protein [Paraburkholderia bannensis]
MESVELAEATCVHASIAPASFGVDAAGAVGVTAASPGGALAASAGTNEQANIIATHASPAANRDNARGFSAPFSLEVCLANKYRMLYQAWFDPFLSVALQATGFYRAIQFTLTHLSPGKSNSGKSC